MPTPLKVLFVASECAHFVKSGGLGDVVAALPVALRKLGHDVRIVMPRYDAIAVDRLMRHAAPIGVPVGKGTAWGAVFEASIPKSDVPVYLLDHETMFCRGYLYDPPGASAPDNLARFTFLSRGALELCRYLDFTPDVIHVHDWPSALLPAYLNTLEAGRPLSASATVLTIHNLAYQPRYPASEFELTGLPWSEFRRDGLEDHGAISPFKGGLYHATKITTVSPTYASEIRTPEGGFGLDALMRFRGADLVGILNGIDESVWNPATDPHIAANFSAADLSGKAVCKRALQRELGLDERDDVPLIGVVSRLNEQKGTDVILSALSRLLALDTQVVILGSGDPAAEGYLHMRSRFGGTSFRAWVGFHEPLAHRIEAGCDLFLMPSRFEPCGLNQMYSQRYGTLPIVRATGGLEDTVAQFDASTDVGTGFKLWSLTVDSLVDTVAWALHTFREQKQAFRRLQVRAMTQRFGWDIAARRYSDVYDWAVDARRPGRLQRTG